MTQNELEHYTKWKRSLIWYDEELRQGNYQAVDTVVGSMHKHPYIKRTITIRREDIERKKEITKSIKILSRKCTKVEAFIGGVKDEEIKVLLRMHYIEGYSWPKIRKKLGAYDITTDWLRKKAKKYLRKIL